MYSEKDKKKNVVGEEERSGLREEKILKVKYKYLDYNENQEPYFKVCIIDDYGSELVGLLTADDSLKSDV